MSTDPDNRIEDLATRAVLRELVDAVQKLEPYQRHLLQQVWTEERDQGASADQPGLARIYDSLQALVLQLRRATGEADG